MIEFNFTLNDTDAENLFGCISACITRSQLKATKAIAEDDEALAKAYKMDAEYLQSLKDKLLNKHV